MLFAPAKGNCIGLNFRRVNDSANLSSVFLPLAAPQQRPPSHCISIGVGSCTRYHIQFRSEMEFSVKSCAPSDVLLQPVATNFHSSMCQRTPKRFHLASKSTHTHICDEGMSSWKSHLLAQKYKCKQSSSRNVRRVVADDDVGWRTFFGMAQSELLCT